MIKTKILVTGSKGQLGQCLKEASAFYEETVLFVFTSQKELDITKSNQVFDYFKTHNFDYCINCAAYTAVDKAEREKEKAFNINVTGVKNLAKACLESETTLIHISTDFVFDGQNCKAYKEDSITNPISVYGRTKLEGENVIQSILNKYYIIRTSWLYSEFGNNFVKTILNLSLSKKEIDVVDDQIGTPTYAKDLTKVILKIVKEKKQYGLYHYSNEGIATWYDFAKAIFEIKKIQLKINPVDSEKFKTEALRPNFSLLNKSKIRENFKISIPYWKESLCECLKKL